MKRRQVFVVLLHRMLVHQNPFIVGVVGSLSPHFSVWETLWEQTFLLKNTSLNPGTSSRTHSDCIASSSWVFFFFFFFFSSPPLTPRVTSIRKRLGSSWKRYFDFLHLKKCTGGLCVRLPCPFDSFAHLHDNTLQDSRPRFWTSNFKLFKMVFNHPEYIIGYKFMEMCFASVAIVNI